MADAPFPPTDTPASSPAAPQSAAPSSSAPPSSAPPSNAPPQPATPVVVKKYANRRLYNTETSSYITLDNLADMIRAGRDFVVYDAKSGEDITRGVLTQIIVEEESKGTSMLPTAFLRQLIGFYGDSLQGVVPRYLESAMSSFARQQQQLRQAVQQSISPFLPAGVEEMGRQNLAMIERAMSLFNPFHRGTEPVPPASGTTQAGAPEEAPELDRLRQEVESLKSQLAAAQASAAHDGTHPAPVAEVSGTDAGLTPLAGGQAGVPAAAGHTSAAAAADHPAHEGTGAPVAASEHPAAAEPPHAPLGAGVPHGGHHTLDDAIHHAVDAVAARVPIQARPAAAASSKAAPAAALRTPRRTRTQGDKA